MQNDKYSFRFTKFKGSSDSLPILRTFTAYFRPSLPTPIMTKPEKYHPVILSPAPKDAGILEGLNLKINLFFFSF